MVIANYQVTHLSGSRFRNGHVYLAEPQERDVEEALQFLDSIPFFGIVDDSIPFSGMVEKFEVSLKLLEKTLKPCWLDSTAESLAENVSTDRIASFEERIEGIRRELGEDVFRHFRKPIIWIFVCTE